MTSSCIRKLGNRQSYHHAVDEDIHAFVEAIRNWTAAVIGDDAAQNLSQHTQRNFTWQDDGRDLKSNSFQSSNIMACVDVTTLARMGRLLGALLNTADPKRHQREIRSIQWRPSLQCMKQHKLKYLGGGSGAGFEVRCGADNYHVLLKASCGGGGGGRSNETSSQEFWYRGGSQLHMRLAHGRVVISGGGRKWKVGTLFEEGGLQALGVLTGAMRSCASNQSLWIQGGGGGGWEATAQALNSGWEQNGFGFDFNLTLPGFVGGRPAETSNSSSRMPDAQRGHSSSNSSMPSEAIQACLSIPSDSEVVGPCWAAAYRHKGNSDELLPKVSLIENDPVLLYPSAKLVALPVFAAGVVLAVFASSTLPNMWRRRGYSSIPGRRF